MFNKILIANRGEVALRIMRACKELGVKTVAVYSTEDADTYPVQYADEAVCIGPAQANKSYLIMANIIAAAKTTGAEAVHPGYGFLSENADLPACEAAGIKFIGPPSQILELMGDKLSAKQIAVACGVPTTPGTTEPLKSQELLRSWLWSSASPSFSRRPPAAAAAVCAGVTPWKRWAPTSIW